MIPQNVAIKILPIDELIYKISGDLGFENWNFGLSLSGIDSLADIKCLKFSYYNTENQEIHHVEYASNIIVGGYLRRTEKGALTFHNFHHMLPEAAAVGRLEVELQLSADEFSVKRTIILKRYQQRNHYRLPLAGSWFVSSGHDFGVEHRRHLSRGHFAWDFVKVDKNGRLTAGKALVDNFSFGQPVLAPAGGVVIDVVDGEPDNVPEAAGGSKKANYIEIDHGRGEVSRMVHLRQHSVRVAVGDSVVAGQVIAQVGNSGNSDTPHLHFGFQKSIADGKGGFKQIPLPIEFSGYRVSWNQGTDMPVKSGRPRRGQFVRHIE